MPEDCDGRSRLIGFDSDPGQVVKVAGTASVQVGGGDSVHRVRTLICDLTESCAVTLTSSGSATANKVGMWRGRRRPGGGHWRGPDHERSAEEHVAELA